MNAKPIEVSDEEAGNPPSSGKIPAAMLARLTKLVARRSFDSPHVSPKGTAFRMRPSPVEAIHVRLSSRIPLAIVDLWMLPQSADQRRVVVESHGVPERSARYAVTDSQL